jgi:hypothetical protein
MGRLHQSELGMHAEKHTISSVHIQHTGERYMHAGFVSIDLEIYKYVYRVRLLIS